MTLVQILQAGNQQYLYLELDHDTLQDVIRQTGFEARFHDHPRHLTMDLEATERQAPLLLFDAADPGNLGWFSRCQFYVDGLTGSVLQTPIVVANLRDRHGRMQHQAIRLQIARELPANFRLPGKAPVTEQMIYSVLANFLNNLLNIGVGVCGTGGVKPLAGRGEIALSRP